MRVRAPPFVSIDGEATPLKTMSIIKAGRGHALSFASGIYVVSEELDRRPWDASLGAGQPAVFSKFCGGPRSRT